MALADTGLQIKCVLLSGQSNQKGLFIFHFSVLFSGFPEFTLSFVFLLRQLKSYAIKYLFHQVSPYFLQASILKGSTQYQTSQEYVLKNKKFLKFHKVIFLSSFMLIHAEHGFQTKNYFKRYQLHRQQFLTICIKIHSFQLTCLSS